MTTVAAIIRDDLDGVTITVNEHGKVEAVTASTVLERLAKLESYFSNDKLLNKHSNFVVGKVGFGNIPRHLDELLDAGIYSTTSFSNTSKENGFPTDGGIAEIIVNANSQIIYYSTYRDDTGSVIQSSAVFMRTYNAGNKQWKEWIRVS